MKFLNLNRNVLYVCAVLILACVGFFVYQYEVSATDHQKIIAFGKQRDVVMSDYVDVVIGFSPDMLKNPPPTCDGYSTFTSDINLDSRQMSVADLKNALALWDSCHYDVTSDQYTADGNFSDAISKLKGMTVEIRDGTVVNLATQIADDWRKTEDLESQKTDLVKQSVDDEQAYWQAELGYKSGTDSFQQRQDTFQTLNT